jgi:thymidylate kinase
MERRNETRELLIKHFEKYPKLRAEDIFKFIFQSAFGCEHLVSNEAAALEYIKKEYSSLSDGETARIEKLDGEYARVHLSCLRDGLSPETLARLFCLSAKKEENGQERLLEKLSVAAELVDERIIPLDREDFERKLDEWREAGYPAVHHSDAFRSEYHPAYRVISDRYVAFLPLFERIDRLCREQERVVIAIEGGSASGKSTLADMLSEIYDCNIFHMDDFFLRPEQRTSERLSEMGGNIDRERFEEEVAQPLCKGESVCFRAFDCATQTLGEPISVEPKRITVVEGVYSMHPSFSRYYDLSVFLKITPDLQRKRITLRNSPIFAKRFFEEWIPLEERYFVGADVKLRADMIIDVR